MWLFRSKIKLVICLICYFFIFGTRSVIMSLSNTVQHRPVLGWRLNVICLKPSVDTKHNYSQRSYIDLKVNAILYKSDHFYAIERWWSCRLEDIIHTFSTAFLCLGSCSCKLSKVPQTSSRPCLALHLFQENCEAFHGRMGYIIPLACSGSAPGSPPRWTCLDSTVGCQGGILIRCPNPH